MPAPAGVPAALRYFAPGDSFLKSGAYQWRGLGQHRAVNNVTLGAQLLDQFANVASE